MLLLTVGEERDFNHVRCLEESMGGNEMGRMERERTGK